MLHATWKKNDRKAVILIVVFSLIVFVTISVLNRLTIHANPGFNVHIFAKVNAVINSLVTILLLCGLIAVKSKKFLLHKRIMLTSIFLSILFLISYICYHLLSGEARFGDADHNGVLDASEKVKTGSARFIYYIILGTHIPLAGIVLPFILFTAYRALIGEFDKHKKLVRITWPLWLYVAVSGVIVYIMISPYYQ